MKKRSLILLFLALFSLLPTHGELAPESREDASHVVVGEVTNVFKSEGEEYITYVVEIHVEAVDKGEGPTKGQSFFVECFERKPHEGAGLPAPGASGHSGVPKVGERVRVFTNQTSCYYMGVFPNWADLKGFAGGVAGDPDVADAEVSRIFKGDRRKDLVGNMVMIRVEEGDKEEVEANYRYLYAEYTEHINGRDSEMPKVGERLRVIPFEGKSVYEGVYPDWYDVLEDVGDEKAAKVEQEFEKRLEELQESRPAADERKPEPGK